MPAAALTTSGGALFLLLVLSVELADALRMINLDAPESAFQGDTIQLSCHFNLAGQYQQGGASAIVDESKQTGRNSKFDDYFFNWTAGDHWPANNKLAKQPIVVEKLYAIKWYKDDKEFFRYLAQELPDKLALPLEAIQVDQEKSNNHTVTLRNVSLKTSGLFKCEVSTDAPSFVTKFMERKMVIYAMPSVGPSIALESINSKNKSQQANLVKSSQFNLKKANILHLGDQLELLCVSSQSKPAAQLSWYLNDKLINLSTTRGYHQSSIDIQIKSERFVQVPKEIIPSGRLVSLQAQAKEVKQAGHFYEIIKQNETSVDLIASFDSNKPTISLEATKMDHLMEMSASRISFTLDETLIRVFLENSGKPTKTDRLIAIYGTTGSRPNQLARARPNSSQLKLVCVSTVLAFNMTGEIKFRVVNGSKQEVGHSEDSNTLEAQPRKLKVAKKKEVANNGAILLETNLFLLIFAVLVSLFCNQSSANNHKYIL